MKKTTLILLLVLGAVLMMAKSASAHGPARGNPVILIPTRPPQPFSSAS